ncbi:hypothetical protein SAMN05519103_09179 [Rhizobiales bacterium GAS113]|nr:hypothetical protein SAMN05519103_09179 [Rhizobiales bacterium GAS113]
MRVWPTLKFLGRTTAVIVWVFALTGNRANKVKDDIISDLNPKEPNNSEIYIQEPNPKIVEATPGQVLSRDARIQSAPSQNIPASTSSVPWEATPKAEAAAGTPSLPDELVDSSVSPRARSTGEASSEVSAPVVADVATPLGPASLPPATPPPSPIAAASPTPEEAPEDEAVASTPSLPDELVDSTISPRARSTGEASSEVSAPVVADVAAPLAPASPPATPPPSPIATAPPTPEETPKGEAAASTPSLPDELVDSSVSPKIRPTGEASSEVSAPVVANAAAPLAPASTPPATPPPSPIATASPTPEETPRGEAVASTPSLPDELVDSSGSPKIRSTGEAPPPIKLSRHKASAPPTRRLKLAHQHFTTLPATGVDPPKEKCPVGGMFSPKFCALGWAAPLVGGGGNRVD